MKLKRFLATALSAVMVFNTLSEPMTSMAMGNNSTDIPKAEAKFHELIGDESSSYEQKVDSLLNAESFYEDYKKAEETVRKEFLSKLSDEETYELKAYAKYELVNAFADLGTEPKKEDVEKVADYINLYAEIPSKELENPSIELDQKICKKISAKYDKQLNSYDTLNDYLQTILPFDIKEFFVQIDTFSSVDSENLAETVIKFRNYVLAVYGFDQQKEESKYETKINSEDNSIVIEEEVVSSTQKSGNSLYQKNKGKLQGYFYGTLAEFSDNERNELIDNLTADEAYEMYLYAKYSMIVEIVEVSRNEEIHKERLKPIINAVPYFREISERSMKFKPENKEKIDEDVCKYMSEHQAHYTSSFEEFHKFLQTMTDIEIDKLLVKMDEFVNEPENGVAEANLQSYIYNIFGFSSIQTFAAEPRALSKVVYNSADKNTYLPAGYGFKPRFIPGTTTVSVSDTMSHSGYSWQTYATDYKVLKNSSGNWYKPTSASNGKLVVTYKNVGTYQGDIVDLRITYTQFGGDCRGVAYGQNCIAFGYANFNNNYNSSRYMTLKFDFLRNNTQTLFSEIKGSLAVNDLDYQQSGNGRGPETMELVSGCGGTIYTDSANSSKFSVSGNIITPGTTTGGDGAIDGANFAYTFTGPSHTIKWKGCLQNYTISGVNVPEATPLRHTVNFNLQGGYTNTVSNSSYLTPQNGWYRLHSVLGPYIHVKSQGRNNGAKYVAWSGASTTIGDSNNALYYLCRYKDTEYYLIINCRSGKYLQLDGNETNVKNGVTGGKNSKPYQYNLAWKSDGSVEEDFLWSFKKVGNYVSLINKANGLAFDLPNAATANGTEVQMYPSNNSQAQQFTWEPVATTGTTSIQSKYKVQGSTFNLPYINVYRTGYQFTGWNTAANGSGTSYKAGSNYTPDQDGGSVTMYAQYTPNTYKVVYDKNMGTLKPGEYTASSSHTYDVAKALSKNTFITPTGYKFAGWATSRTGPVVYSDQAVVKNLTSVNGGVVTLYAKWIPDSYSVTYAPNGGSGSNQTQSVTYDTAWTTKGATFSKTGYTQTSWNTAAAGNGTKYSLATAQGTWTRTSGLTLYAQYTPNTYKVVYNGNGATGGSTATSSHTYGVAKALTSNGFTKTGHTFAGWATSASGGVVYKNGASVSNLTSTNGGTVNLYAVWTPNTYTITYNANGGSGAPAAHSYTYAASGTINLSSTKPTRTGYTFLGWSLSSTATSASYSAGQAWARSNAANYTLYAVWKANSYAVTYAPNGGSGSNQTQSVTYNTAWTTKGATFSKTGYTQTSWNTAAAGNGTKYSLATAQGTWTRTSGLTLYAQYTPNTYKVVYNGNGATGGSTATSSHTYDVSKALTSNGFTRTGYTFKGWATSASGGVAYANGASVKNLTSTNGGTVNLYAVWQINSYTLTVNPNGGAFNGSSSVQSYTQNYGTSKPLPNPSKTGHTFGGWLLSGYGSINGMTTTDPTFKSGMGGVSVYNNSGGSHVAISRMSAQADNPSDSAYELKITNTGTTTSPGNGGFYQSTLSKANTTYVHQFVAKIPVGYTLNIAHNSLGTGYSESWLTSRVGTGKWETYAYQIRTGSSGTFSTFGHVYITGGASSFTWYLSSSQITDISIKSYTYGAGNGTIVAQWNPIKYNIVYNGNGATGGSTASTEHIYNQAKALRSNGFTKTGYTFAGWATSATGNVVYSNGASVKNLTTSLNGAVNLYAKWTPNTYKVVYNGNGATGGSTASSTHTYDAAKTLTANGFTRTGYTFKGWATSPSGGVAYGNGASVKNLTSTNGGTVNLYAVWQVNTYTNTIAHWAGGFKNSEGNNSSKNMFKLGDSSFTANYNSNYVMNESRKTTIPNGFYLASQFGTSSITGAWKQYAMGTTVTQKPNAMSYEYDYYPTTYNITYNLAGGANNSANPATYNVLYGVTLKNPTRAGYTFAGWEKNLFHLSQQVFTYTNTVSGNKFNSSKVQIWKNGKYLLQPVDMGSVGNVSRQYIHNYDSGLYDIRVAVNGTTQDYSNVASGVYLEKGKTYTFSYTTDTLTTDKCVMSNVKIVQNGAANVTGINEGKNATFTSASQLYSELATRQTGNIALTAKWTPNKYTVSYNGNGATSGSMSNTTATYDAPFITSKNAFAKTGYTFNGWNEKADGSGTKWTLSSYGVYEFGKPWTWTYTTNITLYAQWTPNKYTISYNGNGATGGSTASSNHTYDAASALTPNGFTKTDFKFIGWNTKPDGSGKSYSDKEVIKNLTSTNGSTLQFYAQWEPTKVEVVYDANTGAGAAGNTTVTENVAWEKADNYLVRKNKTDIQFSKSRNTFAGWGSTNDANPKDPNLYVDSKDYNVNLKNESKSQQPRVATFSLRRALEEKPQTVDIGVTETGAPKVTFHATWDKAPTITVPGNDTSKVFYEGTTVTRADLLKNITASDEEDGTLTGQIKIVKIEYAAGRLVNGVKQNAYTKEWKTGMPDTETLDTWFMELDKNQSPVKHKVTFEVTDSAGNVTTATQTVSVKYNEFPQIKANDRYFTLDEAQSGVITDKVLREEAIQSGDLKATDNEEDKSGTVFSKKVTLLDFNATEFKNFTESGYRKLTFHVQDTYGPNGKGKESICQITVYVVKDGEVPEVEKAKEVRFISEKYYNLNKDCDPNAMSEAEKETANDNGGLNVESKWYTDAEYKALIQSTFGKTTGDVYLYEYEDLEKIRNYVETHGIGNAKESDGLSKFAAQFMTGEYRK